MQAQTPLITVYITNYNYGRYLAQAIESVLNQSFQDFEILIIDDGSTDESRAIIESYRSHPKISIIYQLNKGLNITNNIAMRAANGKYLMRLDADDFLELNALEKMSEVLEADDLLGLVFPDYYYVDINGTRIGVEIRHNFDKEVSLYDQPAHGACTMIRLEFLKELGGYNESFTCQDGYDLWIKFIMHHPVKNISEPLFSYRQHGANLTTNENKILDTRKRIKDLHIESFGVKLPVTVAVIPVRSKFIEGVNWPLAVFGEKTILETAIDVLANSSKVSHIAVTTADEDIMEFLSALPHGSLPENLIIVPRPTAFAGVNETLSRTYKLVIETLNQRNIFAEALLNLAIEYPFITTDIIDDAINTLSIFKADSLLSVRPDNKMYYQHNGNGMVPLLDQEKFTKLEREALYSGAGGIVLSTMTNFLKNNKLVSGSVTHIVVDQKAGFGVFTAFDFKLFKAISMQNTTVI